MVPGRCRVTTPNKRPGAHIGTIAAIAAAVVVLAALAYTQGWFESPPPVEAKPLTGEQEIAKAIDNAALVIFIGLMMQLGRS